jgi:sorbitol/mannitol transport system permease protein
MKRTWLLGVAAWAMGLLFVAPVLWMVLTSLHSESDAATNPPSVAAHLTLSGYREFFDSNRGRRWPTRPSRRSSRRSW